jgi:DegV family protein with EDD domain
MAAHTVVVTDSFACYSGFTAASAAQSGVTIVPNRLAINGKSYREGMDFTADEALRLISREAYAPTLTPPSIADYVHVYGTLIQQADAIISLHASREISQSWANARTAAQQVSHPHIAVLDSRSLSAGQAMLVNYAVQFLSNGTTFDEATRYIRSAVERTYSIFYLETMDYLFQNRVIEPAHVILGAMVGIKPVLTIENGRLVAIEKVKTRSQAIERLVEFAVEFTQMSEAVILQPKPHLAESTRMLQDRLVTEFPNRVFTPAVYGASLAALIGTDALGLVILENEMDDFNGDF